MSLAPFSIVALLATTALTIVLGVTDPVAPLSYPTWFLVWNLFLAWIPVYFAGGFAVVRRRRWLLPLGLGWLTFLPNSPYLVTDLVHLGEGVELLAPRPAVRIRGMDGHHPRRGVDAPCP